MSSAFLDDADDSSEEDEAIALPTTPAEPEIVYSQLFLGAGKSWKLHLPT
jgi:hypothetical protein